MLTVLLGGARSGKTSTAIRLAGQASDDVIYVATCPRLDPELIARIARHRAERPAAWRTFEEEIDLTAALERAGEATVVVDCLTLWVNNLLHHGVDDGEIRAASERALATARSRRAATIVVSNEVGMGIVPDNELARSYRDLLGHVNQQWVANADAAWLMVAGRALSLREVGP